MWDFPLLSFVLIKKLIDRDKSQAGDVAINSFFLDRASLLLCLFLLGCFESVELLSNVFSEFFVVDEDLVLCADEGLEEVLKVTTFQFLFVVQAQDVI